MRSYRTCTFSHSLMQYAFRPAACGPQIPRKHFELLAQQPEMFARQLWLSCECSQTHLRSKLTGYKVCSHVACVHKLLGGASIDVPAVTRSRHPLRHRARSDLCFDYPPRRARDDTRCMLVFRA
jgi:hypothetical protein